MNVATNCRDSLCHWDFRPVRSRSGSKSTPFQGPLVPGGLAVYRPVASYFQLVPDRAGDGRVTRPVPGWESYRSARVHGVVGGSPYRACWSRAARAGDFAGKWTPSRIFLLRRSECTLV